MTNQGTYATTKWEDGDVGVGNCGVRGWQVCEIGTLILEELLDIYEWIAGNAKRSGLSE